MKLTNSQISRIRDAILAAYDEEDFDELLRFNLDRRRIDITTASSMRSRVLAVVDAAYEQGWLADLVIAICKNRPHNIELASLRDEIQLKHQQGQPEVDSKIIGVPFKPSVVFVGRASEIDALRTVLLRDRKPIAVSATVEGLGGIGKTELILQLLNQVEIKTAYRTIVWIDGSGPILPQWEHIAVDLDLALPHERPVDLVEQIRRVLVSRGPSLIVLDNAHIWSEVADLIPSDVPLLVTTRTQSFGGATFVHQELGVLSVQAAETFLTTIVPELATDPALSRLIERLDGHALAIELAAWNIRYLGLSAEEYLDNLSEHVQDSPLAREATKYGRTVDSCLDLTWRSLRSEGARTLWRRAALFAPTSAHRDLLRVSFIGVVNIEQVIHQYNLSPRLFRDHQQHSPREFNEAYGELRAFHVLARVEGFSGERWAMHRLVRDFGRSRLKKGDPILHSLALARWLEAPNIPLAPEIPHFVTTVLDAARYKIFDELDDSARSTRIAGIELLGEITSSRQRSRLFSIDLIMGYINAEIGDPKALKLIFEGLSDYNNAVRQQAVALLARVAHIPEIIVGLATCLTDPNREVRERAAGALIKHGGEPIITLLHKLAKGDDNVLGFEAIRVLGQMRSADVDALEQLLTLNDSLRRAEVALQLAEQGHAKGLDVILEYLEMLIEHDARRVCNALAQTGDSRAAQVLVGLMEQSNTFTTVMASLKKMGQTAHDALDGALTNSRQSIRLAAAKLLAEQGQPNGINALANELLTAHVAQNELKSVFAMLAENHERAYPALRRLLSSKNLSIRIMAAKVLAEQKQLDGIDALVEVLLDDKSKNSNIEVAFSALQQKDAHVQTALRKLLDSKNPEVRIEAALSLVKQGQADGLAALRRELPANRQLDNSFFSYIKTEKDQRGADFISQLLPFARQPSRLVAHLANFGEAAHPTLVRLLANENPYVQKQAAIILCNQGIMDGIRKLLELLRTSQLAGYDPQLAYGALVTAVPALLAFLDDVNLVVRRDGIELLREIGDNQILLSNVASRIVGVNVPNLFRTIGDQGVSEKLAMLANNDVNDEIRAAAAKAFASLQGGLTHTY